MLNGRNINILASLDRESFAFTYADKLLHFDNYSKAYFLISLSAVGANVYFNDRKVTVRNVNKEKLTVQILFKLWSLERLIVLKMKNANNESTQRF